MPYVTLVANRNYVKPIGDLETDPEDGITQDDFTAAETQAMRITKGKVGWMYDISDWETTTPPLIEHANELLASAIALEMYLNRDTNVTVGTEYEPEKLEKDGMDILDAIRNGDMELTDASDGHIAKLRISPRQGPRSSSSEATFFPDRKDDKSFGVRPKYSAERTFTET